MAALMFLGQLHDCPSARHANVAAGVPGFRSPGLGLKRVQGGLGLILGETATDSTPNATTVPPPTRRGTRPPLSTELLDRRRREPLAVITAVSGGQV